MFHVHLIGLSLNLGSPTYHLNGAGDGSNLASFQFLCVSIQDKNVSVI